MHSLALAHLTRRCSRPSFHAAHSVQAPHDVHAPHNVHAAHEQTARRMPAVCAALLVPLLLAAVLPLAAAVARAEDGGRYALLVGVEKYNPKFLEPLDHAEDDMERVGEALTRLGFNVVTMTSAAELPERRPTLAADIVKEVDRRLKGRAAADTVVLAFSGHGMQLKADAPGPRGERETWFCPERARPDDPTTLLPMSAVLEKLKACPARQKLLLVDACRVEVEPRAIRDKSGVPMVELDAAAPFRGRIPEGMAALFSCSPHQKSYELPDTGGVFTHYVLEYLAGKADPSRYHRGARTVQELAAYVSKQTKDLVDQRLAEDQIPELVLPDGRFTDWSLGTLGAGQRPGGGDLASVDRRPLPALPAVPKPSPPAGRRPGGTVENSLGMKLVVIPAGEFRMGGDETAAQLKEKGFVLRDGYDTSDEGPVHEVRITRPFLMGVHEVTLGDFLSFYNDVYEGKLDCEQDGKGGWGYDAANASQPFAQKPEYRPWSWGHPDMDLATEAGKQRAFRHPVVNVSWNDAVAFCEWLSRKENKKYRLPTEAEWEYACRARTTTRFWNGDDPEGLAAIDNVADAALKSVVPLAIWAIRGRDGHAFTVPVGSFDQRNRFGLEDMHGNVAEWCGDWYAKDYYAKSPTADPKGPSSAGSFRVIRGGCWDFGPVDCRSADRYARTPAYRIDYIGFRVVCELE